VFDAEDFRRQQIAALNSRISKLKPKRYHPQYGSSRWVQSRKLPVRLSEM
jgi:hypothetical protein